VFAGDGCRGVDVNVAGRIALFSTAGCGHHTKVLAAQNAGAVAAVISRSSPPGTAGPEPINIPAVLLAPAEFDRLAFTAGSVRLSLSPAPDKTWGYLRIFDIADRAAPKQIGIHATENTRRCPPPDSGWYTIHNPVVDGNIAYLSWYSDGVRAVDISDPAAPHEIGYYVPAGDAGADPQSLIWGVFYYEGLIYLSDERNGLIIVRLTGA
jgi:hypothetical protein